MRTLAQTLLIIFCYIAAGFLVLYLGKAIGVIIDHCEDDYWDFDEVDSMKVAFWPICLAAIIGVGTYAVIFILLRNIIAKPMYIIAKRIKNIAARRKYRNEGKSSNLEN